MLIKVHKTIGNELSMLSYLHLNLNKLSSKPYPKLRKHSAFEQKCSN